MSSLWSKIDSINELIFEPFRARVVKVEKACAIDGSIVALGTNGVIYWSGARKRVSYSFTSRSMENALKGCIKLELLSEKAVQEHMEWDRQRKEKRDQYYAADNLEDYAKILGLKLTKSQQAKIDKAKGRE